MKNIGIVGGFWSTNIGNSFFNLGALYVLKKIFPNDNVFLISDQPGYWTFNKKSVGNPINSLDHISRYPLDYLAILGPFLTKNVFKIWGKTLKILREKSKNLKLLFLSVGQMKYDNATYNIAKDFLKEFTPLVMVTRDEEVYNLYKDVVPNIYNGVDFAFFIPDIFPKIQFNDDKKYIVFNFDKSFEPKITNYKTNDCLEFYRSGDKIYYLDFSKPKLNLLIKKNDSFVYLFSSLFKKKVHYVTKIEDVDIIRTDHRFNPMLMKKVYYYPNSFVSDVPYTYIHIYSNAQIVISDRVHACVIALAYGNKAFLFNKTGRARLLSRVGAENITKEITSIDLVKLKMEKDNIIAYLKNVLNRQRNF